MFNYIFPTIRVPDYKLPLELLGIPQTLEKCAIPVQGSNPDLRTRIHLYICAETLAQI